MVQHCFHGKKEIHKGRGVWFIFWLHIPCPDWIEPARSSSKPPAVQQNPTTAKLESLFITFRNIRMCRHACILLLGRSVFSQEVPLKRQPVKNCLDDSRVYNGWTVRGDPAHALPSGCLCPHARSSAQGPGQSRGTGTKQTLQTVRLVVQRL
ncbi:hypothetical protein AGOR_G00070350 [Albula goreensis]|uniref:Uncharacterized protein n=1 Tax=Albula goreensis TaxID=1534307 RepID=A0A8T3DVF2_9TELE|nr:hypothetical protein AGOR_G00070350 [Albula goreensis]